MSTGYGRGSKKLGVPTANLPESQFAENLRSLPTGEFFYFLSSSLLLASSTGDIDISTIIMTSRVRPRNVGFRPGFKPLPGLLAMGSTSWCAVSSSRLTLLDSLDSAGDWRF